MMYVTRFSSFPLVHGFFFFCFRSLRLAADLLLRAEFREQLFVPGEQFFRPGDGRVRVGHAALRFQYDVKMFDQVHGHLTRGDGFRQILVRVPNRRFQFVEVGRGVRHAGL